MTKYMKFEDFTTDTNELTLNSLKSQMKKHKIMNLIYPNGDLVRLLPVIDEKEDKFIYGNSMNTGYSAKEYRLAFLGKKRDRLDAEYSKIPDGSVSLIISGHPLQPSQIEEHKHWARILSDGGHVIFVNTRIDFPDPRSLDEEHGNGCYTILSKSVISAIPKHHSYFGLLKGEKYVKIFPQSIPVVMTNNNGFRRNRNFSPYSLTYLIEKYSRVGDTVLNPFERYDPLQTSSLKNMKNLYRTPCTTESEIGKMVLNSGRKYIGMNSYNEKNHYQHSGHQQRQ